MIVPIALVLLTILIIKAPEACQGKALGKPCAVSFGAGGRLRPLPAARFAA